MYILPYDLVRRNYQYVCLKLESVVNGGILYF